jgi:hypothetical protein
VPLSSVRIYRLVENKGQPVLLATNLHMMMGEMEIESCRWDPATGQFSGYAIRPAGEKGNIYIWLPSGMEPEDPRGIWVGLASHESGQVVKIPLVFAEEGRAKFGVRFIPTRKEMPPERRALMWETRDAMKGKGK